MIKKTLKIFWEAVRPQWWLWLIAISGQMLFFIGVNVLQPVLISRFVGELSDVAGKTLSDFSNIIWLWVGLHILQTAVGRVGLYCWFFAASKTLMRIDLKSFQVILSQSSNFFSNNFTGSLVTRFNRFTRSFDILQKAVMFDLNSLFVQLVFPFAILLFIAPIIAFTFLVWSVVFAFSLFYLHKRKMKYSRRVAEFDSKVTGTIADVITNALPVKMFAQFSSEYSSFKILGKQRVKARLKNMMLTDWIRLYKVAFITVLEVVVFLFSAHFAIEGTISVEQVLLIQIYVIQIIRSLWDFGKLMDNLEEAVSDAHEMAEIYDLTPSIQDPVDPIPFGTVNGNIKINNITFSYEDENETVVFKNLTLDIPQGQKVGFVGPSGGGKTTLTKLLLRFMDVNNGSINIDEINISDVKQDDLRSQIAYVPQEPMLFHRSIFENIRYGNPEASKEEVFRAAKLAHADEFIKKLSSGYETLVGERGVKLSGGQKQRVAIARAMLKKSPIIILDEATSALDSKSEKHITAALDNLMRNRTTIVVAHRLSTIKKLDRIIVLKNGQIVEDGSHETLLKKQGDYHELWSHQHGDFLDE